MDKKVKLKLVGLDGNAFSLMAAFRNAAKKQGFPKDWIDKILEDAMSGDYSHLLCVLSSNCADPEEDDEDFECGCGLCTSHDEDEEDE